jgi:putative FmdB family regulatory protein
MIACTLAGIGDAVLAPSGTVRLTGSSTSVMRGATVAVYEFECLNCGERFETTVPMKEHDHLRENPPACPSCKGTNTRQLISLFNCRKPSG